MMTNAEGRRLGKMAHKRAVERVGERGWRLLSFEMKQAFVAHEIVSIILGWHDRENEPASVFAQQAVIYVVEKEGS